MKKSRVIASLLVLANVMSGCSLIPGAHYSEWIVRKAASCFEDGVEYRYNLNDPSKEQTRKIPQIGEHDWTVVYVSREADHLHEGQSRKDCNRCGAFEVYTIEQTREHGWVVQSDKDGHFEICECGQVSQTVAHTYGSPVETAATATADGKRVYTCTTCSYEKVEIIPATGGGSGTGTGTGTGTETGGNTGTGTLTGDYSVDYNGYYRSISSTMSGGMNGSLRQALTSLIKPAAYYTYGGDVPNGLSYILQDADEDPNNPNNMIMFYTQKSVKKIVANGDKNWNREHVWPQSLSGGLYGTSGAGTDILHLRPTYSTTNSIRGNHKYGNVSNHSSTSKIYDGITYGWLYGDTFEPLDIIKGDCARICLYMWVCYFAERNHSINHVTTSLATLVEWSKIDPPSAIEKNRNNYAQGSKQKNRNPFVDHPEWVDYIFG